MILKLIHNNKIGAYAFTLLLVILIWVKPILLGHVINIESFDNAMPLWGLFTFVGQSAWVGFVFSIVSAIIIILGINRLNSKYALLSKQSALGGFVYILLVGGFTLVQQFNPIWIVTLLFMISLEYLFDAHNYRKVMKESFLIAFWISVASLFSYKMILLFPLIIIVLVTLRLLNFKSFLAMLIGLVLPWLFLLGYELLWGSMAEYYTYLGFSWTKVSEVYHHTLFSWIYLGSIAFVFILGVFSVMGAYGTKKIYTRKQYQVFLYSGLYIAALMAITGINLEMMALIAVPFSIVIAHLVDNIRSLLWQNIMIIALAIITIAGQVLM